IAVEGPAAAVAGAAAGGLEGGAGGRRAPADIGRPATAAGVVGGRLALGGHGAAGAEAVEAGQRCSARRPVRLVGEGRHAVGAGAVLAARVVDGQDGVVDHPLVAAHPVAADLMAGGGHALVGRDRGVGLVGDAADVVDAGARLAVGVLAGALA